MPVQRTAAFKLAPDQLATCFQASYAGRYPETLAFERDRFGAGVRLYALMFGTTNDLVLAKRYYWVMDMAPAPEGGTVVALRSRPDWAGNDHAGPEVWQVLSSCSA